jgi:hypothetical protein
MVKVSDFDPETIQRSDRKKLAALRAAIREGLDSGPAEPFDIEAILAEARADYQPGPLEIAAAMRSYCVRASELSHFGVLAPLSQPQVFSELWPWVRI